MNLEMMCYSIPEFSILWLPFTHAFPLDLHQKMFLVIIVLVAAYIAWPLCVQIVQQSRVFLQKYCKPYLAPGGWRI